MGLSQIEVNELIAVARAEATEAQAETVALAMEMYRQAAAELDVATTEVEAQDRRIALLEKDLQVIANASETSERLFGGSLSEVTRVFKNITRAARQNLPHDTKEGEG